MAEELELKAVISDPAALRERLRAAGAERRFRGRMSDRRYDRDGELAGRDEVLRVRSYQYNDGRVESVLGWKGPARLSPEGYKQREELELTVRGAAGGDASPHAFLGKLGYGTVHAIDRDVEIYVLAGATVRLEHYPRMDPLVEVEGDPDSIERAIQAAGLDRASFTADSLADFVRRFEARTGQPARLADA
ncbi:MAG TPA: class IV adenylate cyclase [Gemmatimonadales bacterium]|nr:class IV adenylate cyclase [Gemmatimonadales bacterium]